MYTGIVGAKGFIGSYLTKYLQARKSFSMRLFVRNIPPQWDVPDVEILSGDLLSPVDCVRFVRDVDVIYYLAHTSSPVNSDRDWPSDAVTNLLPLLTLLAAIRTAKTKPHIVYFSSGGAVYAPKADRIPYTEADPCAPTSSYGIQKLTAEQYLRLAAQRGEITAVSLRIGNAYGTQLPGNRFQGLIGVAVRNILSGRPVRIFGDLNNVRDYVHLEDICAIAEKASPRFPYDVVNVGTGIGHSVSDILQILAQCYGGPVTVGTDIVDAQGLADWVVLNNAKAKYDYGWTPLISLDMGIQEMLAGCREELKLGIGTI